MDSSAPTGGGRLRRALLVLAGLLALVAIVALGSGGDTPVGEGGSRSPSETLRDTLLTLLALLMVVGVGLWIVILVIGRDALAEQRLYRGSKSRRNLAVAAVFFIGLGLLVWWMRDREAQVPQFPTVPTQTATGSTSEDGEQAAEPYTPEFAWLPALVVVAIGTVAGIALVLAHRARRRALPQGLPTVVEALADVLDESLDDLRAERDPRRAVIAAYARMERTLSAFGFPRRPAEAPGEFLARTLAELAVASRSIGRLTALYEQARFSQHEVHPDMKEQAIEALETVRDELRAEEIRQREEREAAFREAVEQAGRG